MKKMYWRPQRASLRVLLLLAGLVVGGLASTEAFQTARKQRYYQQKLAAARLAARGFELLRRERRRRGIPVDAVVDPTSSGLIGLLITRVTTNTGHLAAKQLSINPNFAAMLVEMLRRAGVRRGSAVAVGLSGSFPALNVCTLAALTVLQARPLVISSVGASQWGANHPRLTWPDMEAVLAKNKIINARSIAVSPGGIDDRALGLSPAGHAALRAAMRRSGAQLIEPTSYLDSLAKRMAVYAAAAAGDDVAAYINVGGGTISVGTQVGKELFRPGLNRQPPRGPQVDSVMLRYARARVPVIHITRISKLAEKYGLMHEPTVRPAPGAGPLFVRKSYNLWLAAAMLLLSIALLVGFLRLDVGHRLLTRSRHDAGGTPEPMI